MKQPLMVVPPAQAEALYDVELEEETRGAQRGSVRVGYGADDWDDRGSHDPEVVSERRLPVVARSRR